MKLTKEEQRDLLVLEMKRCIELLESSKLSKTVDSKWYGVNIEISELNKKLHEVRRDSVRLMKTIYSEGK